MDNIEKAVAEYMDCLACGHKSCLSPMSDCHKKFNIQHYQAEAYYAMAGSIPLSRLSEICSAERKGRCVVLPPQPDNSPLTLEQLRGMDNERVFVILDDDVCVPALVAYNTEDCSNEDEEDVVYLTNNLGGRSTYEDMLDMGATFYRRKPEPEGGEG